jgi:DNA repair ATPase RecN
VLAVFPEGTHHEAIARILPPLTDPEDKRDPHQTLKYESLDKLITCIHNENGLAIAAHIEADNGLRGLYRATTKLLLEPIGDTPEAQKLLISLGDQVKDELVKFDAIQVTPTTGVSHYEGPDGNLRVPLIVASDCHNSTELAIGSPEKYSYVKMATPTFAGLCDAFKFPDLRVRFHTGLPKSAPPRLLGLRIVSHKKSENTFFDDTVLGFSDNLTCLIGPRGSGKSAMIDGLRYLMGYNRKLDTIQKVAKQVTDRQEHTLEHSRIEALYQTADESVYKLVATYDPQEKYVTEVYDMEGTRLNIEDVEAFGEFPINLFGWGELELLAECPEKQRELLDRFIPDVEGHKQGKDSIFLQLDKNRESCVKLAHEMELYFSDAELDFSRCKEYERKYEVLNTDEIKPFFAEMDSIKAKRQVLINIRQELQERLDEGDITPELKLGEHLESEDLREWAEDFSERLKPDEIDAWMLETNRQHMSKVQTAISLIDTEDKELTKKEDVAEKKITTTLGDEQAITGDLRNNAKVRYEGAAANLAEYVKLYNELQALLVERETLLNDCHNLDNHIFTARDTETSLISDKISLVKDDDYQIDLVLNKQADRSEFLAALHECGLTFYGKWKAGKRPEIISEKLTPRVLAQAILSGDNCAFNGLSEVIDGVEYTIEEDYAEHLVNDNTPYTEIDGLPTKRVDPTKLDIILQVQQAPLDDEFFITLGGQPIQYCSPGQRCSAMLPVVTLTSNAPLIIDQPEDNLDNRLVSRALFKILARLKETRQIILATHNPNILVSGDAEQVLLLDAKGDLEKYGCIDDSGIIDSVLGLMEGGPEAFSRRQKKYASFLPDPQ